MEIQHKTKLNIKDWAEEDRPREKMLLKGVASLSDAELLGILIASGNKNETAVELAQRILHSVGNNLNALGKLEIKDLIKNFNGIGEAKAITIVAAMELGKRRKLAEVLVQPEIKTSQQVYNLMHLVLADLRHEETWVIFLNQANRVIKKSQASKGGLSTTVVDIRMIMKDAIDSLASAMILCHNHPSGNIYPSEEDNQITRKLSAAGALLDIPLLDHIIVGDSEYYSYADKGKI